MVMLHSARLFRGPFPRGRPSGDMWRYQPVLRRGMWDAGSEMSNDYITGYTRREIRRPSGDMWRYQPDL
jgi:hypothetical protein